MAPTIIALSKGKMALLLILALLFVAAGAWMFQLDPAEIARNGRYRNPAFVHGTGIAGMLFFGAAALLLVRKLFDRRPGLIVDAEGIVDNASGIAAGRIPWDDILGFEQRRIYNQRLLSVLLKNPDAYVARSGALRRLLQRGNLAMGYSPVMLSSNALSVDFDTLFALLQAAHAQVQAQGAAAPRA